MATRQQKTELIHGATRFLCATLWTDFDLLGDPEFSMREAGCRMNDYSRISMPDPKQSDLLPEFQASRRRVSLTPEAILLVHQNHRSWLEDRLSEPFEGRTVVVTHHCPHSAVAGPIDSITPAFTSDLDQVIRKYQPEYWFFAHTHRRLTATIGRTQICNTSIGYAGEPRHASEVPLAQLCILKPFKAVNIDQA